MKYRKIPVVIEAEQFTSNNEVISPQMDKLVNWMNQGKDKMIAWHNGTNIFIETLEGTHKAEVGDWIVKGVKGEFYPVKPDIFEMTYEKVQPMNLKDIVEERLKDPKFREEWYKPNMIGEELKILRRIKGLTQKQLGKMVGTKQSGIARAENKEGYLRLDLLHRIARALGYYVKIEIVKETNV